MNQAEGILSGFVKEREDIMQIMQPSVHPSKVAQPSIRRKNKKNANAQPQENSTVGDPSPSSADGSDGGDGPPPPPPPPSNNGGGPVPERENSESLPSPPILNTNLSQDFDIYESEVVFLSLALSLLLNQTNFPHLY